MNLPTEIKHVLTILLLLFFCCQAKGQKLIDSRQTSEYTYIYKITEKEAEEIYSNTIEGVDSTFFHTRVDSFPTDEEYNRRLSQGHYIKTYADQNKQKIAITTIQDFNVFILNNNTDLSIQVYDLNGKIIQNADLKVKKKKLRFNKNTQCYIDKKSNKKGLLSITHDGFTAYYDLSRDRNNSCIKRGYRKIAYQTPLKYVWMPIKFVALIPVDGVKSIADGYSRGTIRRTKNFFVKSYEKIACIFDDYHCNDYRFGERHTGYMVFNKPKYLPGDTVKFKAFLVTKKGKPINKEVSVSIQTNRENVELTQLQPYRKGGYAYEFFLHDSLELKLDRYYSISLKLNGKKEYIRSAFKYEDYELTKTQLAVRLDDEKQFRNQKRKLFIKGTDENDLNILDGRIEVLVMPKTIHKYFDNPVFVPDTLLFVKQQLKPSSETEVLLPDSLFPKINFDYSVNVKLLTSDNEVLSEKKTVNYFYQLKTFDARVLTDSIRFFYKENAVAKPEKVTISAKDNFGNSTPVYSGYTPCTLALNPYYSHYVIEADSLSKSIRMSKEPDLLSCYADRTLDSVFVQVDNPRNIPFSYNIYRGNKEKYAGYADSLNLQQKTKSKQNYFVSIRYLWAGKIVEKSYNIPLVDKQLNVSITEPKLVYPGQKSKIEVLVTNANGKPVENVDVTAYGLTKKFNYATPNLPYFGKDRKGKSLINNFSLKNTKPYSEDLDLNYDAWSILAGLDSIEYYTFIYPKDSIYRFEYESADTLTQFAPFVVSDGAIQPIHVVYVDNKPVYFSWSTHNQPYSFPIDSGFHQINLRTSYADITIDSMYFQPGKKLIFSLNEDVQLKNVRIRDVKPELSQQEQNLLYKYIFPYRQKNWEQYAYLEQDGHIQVLKPHARAKKRGYYFAGPIVGDLSFNLTDSVSTNFQHEHFFEYDFAPELLKMRSVDRRKYPKELNLYKPVTVLADEYISKAAFLQKWEDNLAARQLRLARHFSPTVTPNNRGRLQVYFTGLQKMSERPLHILLFSQDKDELLGIYQGRRSFSGLLNKGTYKFVFFYTDESYHVLNSIQVKPHGLNHYEYEQPKTRMNDKYSIYIKNLIEKTLFGDRSLSYKPKKETEKPIKKYGPHYDGHILEGYVRDEEGEPLPFANVFVEGTTIGTVTDIDGKYALKVPWGADVVVFSYTGYADQSISARSRSVVDVNLSQGELLDEVVVVGYGVTRSKASYSYAVQTASSEEIRRLPTRNVNALAGAVAGVSQDKEGKNISFRGAREGDQIVYVDGVKVQGLAVSASGLEVEMRGASSIKFDKQALYIVNGQVYLGNISDLDPNTIQEVKTLQGSEATALYGAKAANGVVVITTRAGTFEPNKGADFDDAFLQAASQSSSIRENFSDYAFWQPTLRTNKEGKATFELTFPDDVTNWKTHYLAMNGKKQSGQTSGFVKSYKPLMAQLAVPRFLIEADTSYAIGKVLNYGQDSIKVSTQFEINEQSLYDNTEYCTHSIIDTLLIIAQTDSLSVKYVVEDEKGYFDGERRDIPVYPLGLEETKGQFYVLDKDTTLNLTFDAQLGKVNLYARADVLDVIEDEINHLRRYKYFCNEQIASKLKGLIAAKKIAQYKGEEYKYDKDIKKLIRLLKKNQKANGLWGWWKDSRQSEWISLHVLEAITQVEKLGYTTNINKSQIIKKLVWELEDNRDFYRRARILKTLHLLGAQIDEQRYMSMLEETKDSTLNKQLQIFELRALYKMENDLDTLASFIQTTLFGNIYFAEQDDKKTSLLFNDVQNTLLAYKILRADSTKHEETLAKMRNYFLEKRKRGYWRNTYESAQIIETILPDLLGDKTELRKPTLSLTGDVNQVVSEFPFEIEVQADEQISISKSGDFPVYFTSYQRYQNKKPKAKKDDFEITAKFDKTTNSILTAGEETKLIVNITVNKDAEYVMINIPIPGGCSYASKKNYYKNESHREYFKNETAIFCEFLPKGKYTYTIDLIPRYSGNYTLNPAKIELMYFPTFSGNNEMKKVKVK